jgi:hypothetical protein
MPTAKVKLKGSKGPPGDCGGMWDMRCIGPGTKGDWRCSVRRPEGEHSYACAGAVVNGRKGTVRFYS